MVAGPRRSSGLSAGCTDCPAVCPRGASRPCSPSATLPLATETASRAAAAHRCRRGVRHWMGSPWMVCQRSSLCRQAARPKCHHRRSALQSGSAVSVTHPEGEDGCGTNASSEMHGPQEPLSPKAPPTHNLPTPNPLTMSTFTSKYAMLKGKEGRELAKVRACAHTFTPAPRSSHPAPPCRHRITPSPSCSA